MSKPEEGGGVQYYTLQGELLKKQSYTEFQEVVPNLFIGGQISSLNLAKLKEKGVKRVLRVNGISQNVINYQKHGILYKLLDIDDMPDFQIEPFFEEGNQFIEDGISRGEGVLVVCTAGISRSAAIVIAYLLKHRGLRYPEAHQIVKQARIFIQPNVGFERALIAYEEKISKKEAPPCDLCTFVKRTHWFEQYGKKRFGSQLFRVVECDSCECPMIVYVSSHKQQLETEEIIEAFNLCEDVGNDFFGQGRWFIEGKQRKIHDHFHWHVRELKMVNDILAIRLLGLDPQLGQAELAIAESLEDLKTKSFQLVEKHVGGSFNVLEKRLQRGQAAFPNAGGQLLLSSRVRLTFQNVWAIEQHVLLVPANGGVQALAKMSQASQVKYIVAVMYYRVLKHEVNPKKQINTDLLIAKL